MRLSSLVLVAAVIASVEARCYPGTVGDYGLSTDGAAEAVDGFCDRDLAGYFTQGQTKYKCLQLSKNKVELWVGWRGRGSWSLNSHDCKTRLREEINGCALGGESMIADWFFR
jgi:hypothetical protein